MQYLTSSLRAEEGPETQEGPVTPLQGLKEQKNQTKAGRIPALCCITGKLKLQNKSPTLEWNPRGQKPSYQVKLACCVSVLLFWSIVNNWKIWNSSKMEMFLSYIHHWECLKELFSIPPSWVFIKGKKELSVVVTLSCSSPTVALEFFLSGWLDKSLKGRIQGEKDREKDVSKEAN